MDNLNNSKAVVEQVTNNTTSWVGKRGDNKDVFCGQTFIAPSEGDLEAVEIFPSIVTKPGKVVMTWHNFDPQQKNWGPSLGSASIDLNNSYIGKWVAFNIPGMHLIKGNSYGFRMKAQTLILVLAKRQETT